MTGLLRAFLVVGGVSTACAWTWPGAFHAADPVAVLVRFRTPNFYAAVVAWYDVAPGVAVFLAGQLLISTSRIWFARMGVRVGLRSRLPAWPLSPTADGPAIVVGEVHHPVKLAESHTPEWLTTPERGLYTGVAIFGAVGSGKTSACMHPFARQLLSWHADNPERRVAALVLEVKGDFCHDIRRMLTELGRADDYVELSLDGRLTWNPLSATWLDSYSLAYTVASLLNQRFGKGKEPFWQQAYTNLVRWIIELYRVLPGGWVTLRDVYHCAIDKDLFARKIKQAQTYAADMSDTRITITATEMAGDHLTALRAFGNRLVARPSRRTKQEVFNLKLQVRVRRYPDRVLDTARLQRLVDRRPRDGGVGLERRAGPRPAGGRSRARASPPVVCAGDVARPQLRRHAVTVIVEQKQRVVADRLEVPVVGAAFLLPCTGLLLESLSSTMRSARSNVSTCPIRSRFTAINPPRLSSRVSSSVSTGSRRSTSLPGTAA